MKFLIYLLLAMFSVFASTEAMAQDSVYKIKFGKAYAKHFAGKKLSLRQGCEYYHWTHNDTLSFSIGAEPKTYKLTTSQCKKQGGTRGNARELEVKIDNRKLCKFNIDRGRNEHFVKHNAMSRGPSPDITVDLQVGCQVSLGENSVPAVPKNLLPNSDGFIRINDDRRTTLSWDEVEGATYYKIRFGGVSGKPRYFSSSDFSASVDVSPEAYYFWGVKACNSLGCSAESAQNFFVSSYAGVPDSPFIDYPQDGSTLPVRRGSNQLPIVWSDQPTATHYKIDIHANGRGGRELHTIPDPANGANVYAGRVHYLYGLLGGENLYVWSVQACNNVGCSNKTNGTFKVEYAPYF